MPQPRKARRFGGSPAHHQMMMANLATELFRHGRIRTTQAKAKTVQPLAEKMITFAKRGDVAARREVLKVVRDRDVVHKLFADIGPAFSERNGGYTRVLKLGHRKGDNAPMALIELVEGVTGDREGTLQEAPRRRWSLRRRSGTLSTTARESAEERAAAADRGEQPQFLETEEPEAADAVPVGALEEEEGGPQVRPEDVEARLAAEDEDETDEDAEGEDQAEASDDADDADESDEDEESKDS